MPCQKAVEVTGDHDPGLSGVRSEDRGRHAQPRPREHGCELAGGKWQCRCAERRKAWHAVIELELTAYPAQDAHRRHTELPAGSRRRAGWRSRRVVAEGERCDPTDQNVRTRIEGEEVAWLHVTRYALCMGCYR